MPRAENPGEKDWRPTWTTPIRDQGSCGSCVAFGVIGALESLLKIRTYEDPNRKVDLSEAHLLFCGGGSCGGWNFPPALDYLKNNGVPDEACFPYQPRNMPCSDTCPDWKNRINYTKIKSWSKTLDVDEMKRRITNNGPQVSGMVVYRDFFYYKTGIYEWDGVSPKEGYHAITVVGFSDKDGCWICKNSWGTGWGEAGWFRIAYGQCGIDSVFGMYNMEVEKVEKVKTLYSSGTMVVDLIKGTLVDDRPAVPCWIHPTWYKPPAEPGFVWIWSSYWVSQEEAEKGAIRIFRKRFDLKGVKFTEAIMEIAADNKVVILVNGAMTGEVIGFKELTKIEITKYLIRDAVNDLVFMVINYPQDPTIATPENNPAGLIYRVIISYP